MCFFLHRGSTRPVVLLRHPGDRNECWGVHRRHFRLPFANQGENRHSCSLETCRHIKRRRKGAPSDENISAVQEKLPMLASSPLGKVMNISRGTEPDTYMPFQYVDAIRDHSYLAPFKYVHYTTPLEKLLLRSSSGARLYFFLCQDRACPTLISV